MLRARSRRKSLGVTLVEVLTATSIMAGLQAQSGGSLRYAITKAREVKGMSNLRQIHMILLMRSMTGRLPTAAFYPEGDPFKDPKSIAVILRDVPKAMWASPLAPEALRKKGLTFAWNTAVNGKALDSVGANTWLLCDLAAFIADPKVAKPSKFLILYANGRADAVSRLPGDIAEAVAKAREAKEKGKERPKGKDEGKARPPCEEAAAS